MPQSDKKTSALARSMLGAKNKFDDRLKKAESLTLATSKEIPKVVEDKPKKVKKSPVSTKPKKEPTKLDSFTFPKSEHENIQKLILDFAKQGIILNKSEVVRLGLHALSQMDKKGREDVHKLLRHVKVGRPSKDDS